MEERKGRTTNFVCLSTRYLHSFSIHKTQKSKKLSTIKKLLDDWRIILALCLTLGLAPYLPEPHIWGKIKWILGGASGMGLIDWFDFVLHGLPWVLGIRLLNKKLFGE